MIRPMPPTLDDLRRHAVARSLFARRAAAGEWEARDPTLAIDENFFVNAIDMLTPR